MPSEIRSLPRAGDEREIRRLAGSLARANGISFALTFGVVVGVSLCLATLWLVVKGGPLPGNTLQVLGYLLPGYGVSPSGALVGLLWGVLGGFAMAFPSAWLYYRGVLQQIARSGRDPAPSPVLSPVRIDVLYFAAACGLLCGCALFLATVFLVVEHQLDEPLGPHLGLLAQYLPGYRISVLGGVIGFFYFLVIGGAVFACTAAIYNRLVSKTRHVAYDASPRPLEPRVLQLGSGRQVGVGPR